MQNEVICKQREEKTIPFGQKLTIITFVHSDNNFRKYMLRMEHAEYKYNNISFSVLLHLEKREILESNEN